MKNKPVRTKRTFGLDLMRATAIIMVLCSHILWIYPQSSGYISQLFQLFGFLGVEVFFVLSGFLIGRILYKLYTKENFTILSVFYFLKRRWYRTLPNYYLILLVNIFIAYVVIGYEIQELWKYFFFVQNAFHTMLPFFPESWSLSIEEFTYLTVPFMLLAGSLIFKNIKNRKNLFFIIFLTGFIFFIANKMHYAFTTNNTTLSQWNLSLKAVVMYRIDAILTGILASWLYCNYYDFWRKYRYVFALFGSLFFLGMYLGVGYFRITIEHFPIFWNVFYLPLTSLTFTLFLPVLSELETPPKYIGKLVYFVSITSYSVYLLHYSVVLQLMKYFFDTNQFTTNQLHVFTGCYLFITFFLSYLFYRFYEKPIMDLRE
ncbi:MAG: acyltransferase [Candidatus Kapabacteria bacterium]|jgi:peptidoglycan/LPS O-acetylase OafA/YrhL|nr:acyltransferase [Candidatus Kapabacteria bacterium]